MFAEYLPCAKGSRRPWQKKKQGTRNKTDFLPSSGSCSASAAHWNHLGVWQPRMPGSHLQESQLIGCFGAPLVILGCSQG